MSLKTVHDANEIINRHLKGMLEELVEKGHSAKAAVAFVVGAGDTSERLDTNIALGLLEPIFDIGDDSSDAQGDELLAFVWAGLQRELAKRTQQ